MIFQHFEQWLMTVGGQPLRANITGDSGRNQSQAGSHNEDKRVLLKNSEQSGGCDGIQLAKKKNGCNSFAFYELSAEFSLEPDN